MPDEEYTIKECDFAAVDVGTTSIEVKYSDGTDVKLRNPQMAYGADVISRISNSEGFYDEMHESITECLKKLIGGCESAVITGNTVMLSIIGRKSLKEIAVYPFKPECLFGYSGKLFETEVYYPPCADSFIGADIVCGVVSSGMTKKQTPVILCDIGTNTEIALWDGKELYFTSAPSGPAFEGGNISCGMPALEGAVSSVYKEGYKLCYDTVDGAEETGICGSGLIDAVWFMREQRILSDSGRIMEYGHRFPHLVTYKNGETAFKIGSISLTQTDIRNFQTAKAAVMTAIELLIRESKIKCEPEIMISGQFGAHLNFDNAVKVKMLPKASFSLLKNAALEGAFKMKDEAYRKKAEELLKNAVVIQLHEIEDFPEKLTQNMNFL